MRGIGALICVVCAEACRTGANAALWLAGWLTGRARALEKSAVAMMARGKMGE